MAVAIAVAACGAQSMPGTEGKDADAEAICHRYLLEFSEKPSVLHTNTPRGRGRVCVCEGNDSHALAHRHTSDYRRSTSNGNKIKHLNEENVENEIRRRK